MKYREELKQVRTQYLRLEDKVKELEEKLEYVKGYVDAARSDDSTAHDTDAVDWIIELLEVTDDE